MWYMSFSCHLVKETKETKDAGRQKSYLQLREKVVDDDFWEVTNDVRTLVIPALKMLRTVDHAQPLVAWIWPMMYSLEKKMEQYADASYPSLVPQEEREAMLQAVKDRWIYLHRPVHSLAYCLNPYFNGVKHFEFVALRLASRILR